MNYMVRIMDLSARNCVSRDVLSLGVYPAHLANQGVGSLAKL